ncbi:MAG: RNA polymerase sigma factor SigW, partial [Clostridia bacterium]|nr:RNA polymerase sigma factor SigW [Clostridia bacterium]
MNGYKNSIDKDLVEMTLMGDENAYEELVTRHERSVHCTAYKITGNKYSAEDASQDAFVAAWTKLDTLKEREKFGSWICAIAKNCAFR